MTHYSKLDKSGFVGAILMDLSKAYSLPHDLLMAKFGACGIGKSGLHLFLNYLSNRKQRAKVSSAYSDWYDIISGVLQGSILGPLLFYFFLSMISSFFLEKTNICNFADDNTIYRCDSLLVIILKDFQHGMKILLNWFKINSMKPDPKKFQFMILGKGSRLPVIINVNNINIRES